MAISSSRPPIDQSLISFGEALVVVSEVLERLHDANITLQDRIAPSVGASGASLIEDLQVLDRQAQITLDLVQCLRRLADAAPGTPPTKRFSKDQLFQLDATRHALERSVGPDGISKASSSEDIWL